MSGQPKRDRLIKALERRAVTAIGDEATPLEYVCAFIENGGHFRGLAASLEAEMGESISRPFVSNTANNLSPDARARIEAARRASAEALVDESRDIADATPADKDAVALSKLQISSRQWTAERYNRSLFGAAKAEINLSFGAMHLDALRHRPGAAHVIEGEARMLSDGSEAQTDGTD